MHKRTLSHTISPLLASAPLPWPRSFLYSSKAFSGTSSLVSLTDEKTLDTPLNPPPAPPPAGRCRVRPLKKKSEAVGVEMKPRGAGSGKRAVKKKQIAADRDCTSRATLYIIRSISQSVRVCAMQSCCPLYHPPPNLSSLPTRSEKPSENHLLAVFDVRRRTRFPGLSPPPH